MGQMSLTDQPFPSITDLIPCRNSSESVPGADHCGRALTLSASGSSAQTSRMPVSEIQPGMIGIGRTVFNGTRVEEFKAHVLGVIENVMGPQRNLILARLEGGPLADTGRDRRHERQPGLRRRAPHRRGVVLARQFLQGTHRRHHANRRDDRCDRARTRRDRPRRRIHVEYPLTREALVAAFRKALNWNRPFADRPGDARLLARRSGRRRIRRQRRRQRCCGPSPRRS